MKLKAFVDDINAVPEQFRDLYVKETDKDGKETGRFKLDAEGVEDTAPLKNAYERTKTELAQARAIAEQFKNIDPAKYEQMKADINRAEEERRRLEEEQQRAIAETKRELTEKHQREKDALTKTVSDLTARLHTTFRDNALTGALAKHKGIPELLLGAMGQRVQVEDANGQLSYKVLGKDGKPWLTEKGEPATLDDLVKEFQESTIYGRAFDGEGMGGSGAGGGGAGGTGGKGSGGGVNPWKQETFNLTEQGRITKENPATAERLMREAGVRPGEMRTPGRAA